MPTNLILALRIVPDADAIQIRVTKHMVLEVVVGMLNIAYHAIIAPGVNTGRDAGIRLG